VHSLLKPHPLFWQALPVYKHGVGGGGGGLSTLLEPHRVKLSYAQKTIEYSQEEGAQEGVEGGGNGDVDAGKKGDEGGECVPLSVLAEPIVTVSQLSNHVLRTSYVPHAGYQVGFERLSSAPLKSPSIHSPQNE
jgi:hypothetical protein